MNKMNLLSLLVVLCVLANLAFSLKRVVDDDYKERFENFSDSQKIEKAVARMQRAGWARGYISKVSSVLSSDSDFGKYFHLPVSVNFGKWILFTGKLPVNQKN
jgi:hypothetical protein